MESVRNIRLFLKVLQAGSFSAAGRQSGLSPAAVSRSISMLESDLQAQLLYRTSRKLTLTEVGKTVAASARVIIDKMDELEAVVSEHQDAPRGLLHIHTRTSIGVNYLSSAMVAFQRKYPDIELKIWLTEEHQDLIENKIDVAIRLRLRSGVFGMPPRALLSPRRIILLLILPLPNRTICSTITA